MLDVAIEIQRRDLTVEAAFTVEGGERLALFGPSGAGKSSILEAVAGLLRPSGGHVILGGRELTLTSGRKKVHVPPWLRRVALLRQNPGLFPHLSVRHNIRYSQSARSASETELLRVAERLEIVDLLDASPRSLSGGQAHRVALARLLLGGHDALMFDEPYTGLDARLRRVLTGLLRDESLSRYLPSVLVAHELAEAQAFADRIAVIDSGRVLQIAPPVDVVRRPANRRVAELVGYSGFVSGPAGSTIGVHPDRVRPGRGAGVIIEGTVAAVDPSGAGWDVELAAGDPLVRCHVDDDPPAVGSSFVVTVLDPPAFDSDGTLQVPDRVRSG